MRAKVPQESLSGLCYTAENLYSDLLNAGQLIAAASVSLAVEDLRRRVREENGEPMSEVDYYDVQSMIRDARSEIRGEIDNAVRDACRELREELTYEINRREEQIESLWRVLNERTGNLV